MRALLLLIALQFSSTSHFTSSLESAEKSTETVLDLLESRYGSAHTLQATFLERYLDNGRVTRVEAGEAYFLRPGKMRWDYRAPEKNTFLVDGKYVWFYSPADHTATRMPTKRSEDWRTPLAFLTSHMKLSRLCSTLEPARDEKPSQPDDSVYRCAFQQSPDAPPSSVKFVLFDVAPQGELHRILIPQEGGIELEFSFKNWRWNPTLEKGLFQLIPPPDTVIVDGLLSDTPGMRQ
jgi:outer membrane lipoprotein carrier protein